MSGHSALIDHDRAIGTRVLGCDEAGRGCLAGPLSVAAVLIDHRHLGTADLRIIAEVDDSKRLSAKRRGALYPEILRIADRVVVLHACAATIDARGLHRTNVSLMIRALALGGEDVDARLVDGFALGPSAPEHRRLVRGDSLSASIACASVIAKVSRDRVMEALSRRHPGYGFEIHAGYPTRAHTQALADLGPSTAHRLSFKGVAQSAKGVSSDALPRSGALSV
ncbi:ribonuclease HII [Miltoncostaea oceani]|uniref:ribonuclease HII n=1 Tax=Miltoncostaea oceani TaxID=2843216 RepID=UPI001C3DC270|nr:ribonuclease HII [Miltoncostaea oceani]